MDTFIRDIESVVSGDLYNDYKMLKNVFENHARFLMGIGSDCIVGTDSTELLNRARGFRESGLNLCAILALKAQIECLPDTSSSVLIGECVHLFQALDVEVARCAVKEGKISNIYLHPSKDSYL